MKIPRKLPPSAVLKNLSAETQSAIVDYTDGRNGLKPHSLARTVVWLKSQKIITNSNSLSDFRRWFLMREQMRTDEELSVQMLDTCKERGWVKSAEDEQIASQIFFNRLTVARQDPKLWSLVQRIALSRERVELNKKKPKSDDKTAAKNDTPVLTAEEKEAAVNRILGIS